MKFDFGCVWTDVAVCVAFVCFFLAVWLQNLGCNEQQELLGVESAEAVVETAEPDASREPAEEAAKLGTERMAVAKAATLEAVRKDVAAKIEAERKAEEDARKHGAANVIAPKVAKAKVAQTRK